MRSVTGSCRRVTSCRVTTGRGFTGHRENRDIGLTYMNARYYVPYLNRMLTADTIVPDPSNPQSFNRYAYVYNNPVNLTDPSGHCPALWENTVFCATGFSTKAQYDLTEWLAVEVVHKVKSNTFAQVESAFSKYAHDFDASGSTGMAGLVSGMSSLNDVAQSDAIWDIKVPIANEIGTAVTLCGVASCEWVDYSVIGNIHFGFVAGALGVPKFISNAAGGYIEVKERTWDSSNTTWLFENAQDYEAVLIGYELHAYYAEFGEVGLFAYFQSLLTPDVLARLQPPPITVPTDPLPQPNDYPAGGFNCDDTCASIN
ncbi:MAG: RHS repeat-associated core domain-containing protein [Chloroflexota bacterium]